MKNLTMAALVLIVSASAFATKYTGKIADLVPDDGEGVKVIMQIGTGIVLYSSRNAPQHAVVIEKLEKAKTEDKAITVEANGALNEILQVYGN